MASVKYAPIYTIVCTCPSSLLGSLVCKHVHVIHSDETIGTASVSATASASASGTSTASFVPSVINGQDYFQDEFPIVDAMEQKKLKMFVLLDSIKKKGEAMKNEEAMDEALHKLSTVEAYLSLYSENSIPRKPADQKRAWNKKMDTQVRLFSIRKKRVRCVASRKMYGQYIEYFPM